MKLAITTTGKAVARSGLLPETANQLLGYVSESKRQADPIWRSSLAVGYR